MGFASPSIDQCYLGMLHYEEVNIGLSNRADARNTLNKRYISKNYHLTLQELDDLQFEHRQVIIGRMPTVSPFILKTQLSILKSHSC
jgi:hypothetical protein